MTKFFVIYLFLITFLPHHQSIFLYLTCFSFPIAKTPNYHGIISHIDEKFCQGLLHCISSETSLRHHEAVKLSLN